MVSTTGANARPGLRLSGVAGTCREIRSSSSARSSGQVSGAPTAAATSQAWISVSTSWKPIACSTGNG